MPDLLALRSVVARMTTSSGCYTVGQGVCGRVGGGFILAYHDQPGEVFERQVEALEPNEPVHLSELVDRARSGRSTAGLFAVTCDDGVATTVRDIGAVCLRRGWPVTFYLPTGYLDERGGMPFQRWNKLVSRLPRAVLSLPSLELDLSTPQALARFARDVRARMYTQPRDRYRPLIEELARWLLEHGRMTREELEPPEAIAWSEVVTLSRHEAIAFESHGVTHTAVVALTPAALETELKASQRRISEHTNRACRHFCYPFGSRDSIGATAAKSVARVYDSAVTMTRGRLRRRPWCLLPRIAVYERDSPDTTRLKILTV